MIKFASLEFKPPTDEYFRGHGSCFEGIVAECYFEGLAIFVKPLSTKPGMFYACAHLPEGSFIDELDCGSAAQIEDWINRPIERFYK